MIQLTNEECGALYDLINDLSGGNAENVFTWDEPNDLSHPWVSACAKVFVEADRAIPDNLKSHFGERELT